MTNVEISPPNYVSLFQCPRSIKFRLAKFGITQNTGDTFHGDKFNILYQPGQFPRYVMKTVTNADGSTMTKEEPLNGGIPQTGNLNKHLTQLRRDIEDIVPENFSGEMGGEKKET